MYISLAKYITVIVVTQILKQSLRIDFMLQHGQKISESILGKLVSA